MRSPMSSHFLAVCLTLFVGSCTWSADPAKLSDREAALSKLKANKVSLGGLTIEPKDGGPLINLGTGLGGEETSNATDENLRLIAQLPELERVYVYKGKVTTDGLAALAVDGLEQLTLFGDYVDDACLKRIGEMKEIKRFWTNSKKVTSTGWNHLADLRQMQDLNLSETTFDDENMRVLKQMTDLKSLILNKTRISDIGMPSLAGLTKMHDLGIEGIKITNKGMTAKQLDEIMEMYPQTQIFDPSGYWRPERIEAAMKELGKEYPPKS